MGLTGAMAAERDEADATDSGALLQGLLSSHRTILQMDVGVERFRAMVALFDETRQAIRTVDSRMTKLSQERNGCRDEIAFIRRHQARLTTLRGYLSATYRNPDRVIANLDGFALNHPPSKLMVMFKDPERLGIVRGASFLGLIKSGERKEAVENYHKNVLKALEAMIGDHRAYLHSIAVDWQEKLDETSRLLDETAEVKKALSLFLKELQVEHVRIAKQLLPAHVEQLQSSEKKLVEWLRNQKEAVVTKLEG